MTLNCVEERKNTEEPADVFLWKLFSSQKVSLGMLFQKYTALKIIWWIRMAVMMKMASVENDNDEEDVNNEDNGDDED